MGYSGSNYSQTYTILMKGSVAGTESVAEDTDEHGNIISTSEHEMLISDGLGTKRMAFSTRMILSKEDFTPTFYEYKYTLGSSGDSYEIAVRGDQITRVLHRGGYRSEVTAKLTTSTVIVDFNVYHQYDYLVRKYDFRKGGRQSFDDFIPLIGSDVPIALTFEGNSHWESARGAVHVRDFKIEFVDMWTGSFSIDENGRLVRLLVPSQELEVIREDFLPEPYRGTP